MVYTFDVPGYTTQRKWAVYIVKIFSDDYNEIYYYVGKVGDNRAGCNPLISRIGNHFSYNKIHSQLRNKLGAKEFDTNNSNYKIFYSTFGNYGETSTEDKREKINELERRLNLMLQDELDSLPSSASLLNPYSGKSVLKKEKARREGLLSVEDKAALSELIIASMS